MDSAVHFLNNSSPRMLRHIRDVLTVQGAIFQKLPSDKDAKIQREWEEMAKQGVGFTPSQKAKCFGG